MGAGPSSRSSDPGMKRSHSHPPNKLSIQHRPLPDTPIPESAPPLPPARTNRVQSAPNLQYGRPRNTKPEAPKSNPLLKLIPGLLDLDEVVKPLQAHQYFEDIYIRGIRILGENPDPQHANNYNNHKTDTVKKGSYVRFEEFLENVHVKPDDVELSQDYLPRLSTPNRHCPSDNIYTSDSVDNTLMMMLNRLPSYSDQNYRPCPLGMSRQEREKFCLRLDFTGNSVMIGRGWKLLAQKVIDIDTDDMSLIENFSYQYRYPVVEVLLEHWYKLYTLPSPKCLLPATRQTIIDILTQETDWTVVLEQSFILT